MFHYLFTNDLRISRLENALTDAAVCIKNNNIPTQAEDKNANNNILTLGFYFNLTKDSNCTKECCKGNIRKVVLNFIKKFQFPNPRTSKSLQNCIDDGIQLAPMRLILQCLYIMRMSFPDQAFLSRREIADYIFFDENVAKRKNPDVSLLAERIITNRDPVVKEDIPDDVTLTSRGCIWNQCRRQVREMVKVLLWSGCVVEDEIGNIKIRHDQLTRDNEADLFEIITYSDFWMPDTSKNAEGNKMSYQNYMDIKDTESNQQGNNNSEDLLVFNTNVQSAFSRNLIVFGAPGTGKSYTVEQDRKRLLGVDNETDYERVTFHPDYTYANFVGTYKPVMTNGQGYNSSDPKIKEILSVLNDSSKNANEKYSILRDHDYFRDDDVHLLTVLSDLYTNDGELFETTHDENYLAYGLKKFVKLITGEEDSTIAYEYVPGPFMRVYVEALKSARSENPKPYLLIIEEINRANVAAVFGDIFQLLDRDKNGVSEYPIQASEDIRKYLAKELGGKPDDYDKIKLPNNMFIWATMNSADQGVFPMDTAFKRRWDFTYLGIDDAENGIEGKYVTLGSKNKQRVEWNSLRKAINEFLADEKINEDKQLGPYFISRDVVVPENDGTEIDSEIFCEVFKNKVLMYLFEDAAKQKRTMLFSGCTEGQNRYSKICEAFEKQGIGIFNSRIQDKVNIVNKEQENIVPNAEEQSSIDSDGTEQ